jgi:hypothetical protein
MQITQEVIPYGFRGDEVLLKTVDEIDFPAYCSQYNDILL